MSAHSTIGVNDNFSSCESCISTWSSDKENPSWIDIDFCLLSNQFSANRFDNLFFDLLLKFCKRNFCRVLRGDNNRIYVGNLPIFDTNRNLSLTIRAKLRNNSIFSNCFELMGKFVCQINAHW